MSTKQHQLEVSGMPVEVVRKEIKNLHLGVYPPHGRVRVAVPLRTSDETVRLAVVERLPWIRRQQRAMREQPRQSRREMVTGESHFVQGRRYRLTVIEKEAKPEIRLGPGHVMELQVRPDSDQTKREIVLQEWYRERLRGQIPALLDKWEPIIGVGVAQCGIRRMKTRWGTCNIEARRISLNLELAKKPKACLEYILVHEMVHLLERHHNERFRTYMDEFLPQWRTHRKELNRAPLAHEDWEY